jgi:ABC-type transporter Mla maintaining outer membrane lipid asymmetry ATPase subunit MlaF
MADVAVRFEDVSKAFDGRAVLRGLDLEVPRGTTLTVMGGSGSGKTVTLRLAAGLIKPDRGRITPRSPRSARRRCSRSAGAWGSSSRARPSSTR